MLFGRCQQSILVICTTTPFLWLPEEQEKILCSDSLHELKGSSVRLSFEPLTPFSTVLGTLLFISQNLPGWINVVGSRIILVGISGRHTTCTKLVLRLQVEG